jgi:ribonuclease HI
MSQAPQLTIHTDGASRGNPGPAAFAYVIARDGQPPIEEAGRIPNTTNNQAEYTALVRALEHALRLGPDHKLVVYSDSELMVKQMTGQYRVKDAGLKPLYDQAVRLKNSFRHPVKFVHVRREANQRADELGNEVLDGIRPSSPRPAPDPHPPSRPGSRLDQLAVAHLAAAALKWSRGNASDPRPEAVWLQLRELLRREGLAGRPFDDDSEE